jgi:hypothetical protein
MWSPPNKTELPSLEEIVYAKEAIAIVEHAIKDAFELFFVSPHPSGWADGPPLFA